MITISTLQSQIALNRNILSDLESNVTICKTSIDNLGTRAFKYQQRVDSDLAEIKAYKKQIKQYAKLQRALKSEMAYRIRYNRACRGAKMGNYQLK